MNDPILAVARRINAIHPLLWYGSAILIGLGIRLVVNLVRG